MNGDDILLIWISCVGVPALVMGAMALRTISDVLVRIAEFLVREDRRREDELDRRREAQ